MLSSSIVTEVPVEIIREIFSHLLLQHKNSNSILSPGGATCKFIKRTTTDNNRYHHHHHKESKVHHSQHAQCICLCWQLDLLSVSMVCKSWYSIAVELMHYYSQSSNQENSTMPWLPLLNYASHQRTYPFRSRLVKLMDESRLSNLIFHHAVRHLVIDFASFDIIRREKQKNNVIIKRKIHNSLALSDMTELLRICINTEQLDIICDAGFVNLLPQHNSECNSIASNVSVLEEQKEVWRNSKIKRLNLIGYNPIQRCPCCAGRDWDKHLIPLIRCLDLDTLVLEHVLPSEQVLLCLAEQSNLKRIVLHRSLITIPESQVIKDSNGDQIRYKRRDSNSIPTRRENSISRIPKKLWNQITSLSIYEDKEDAFTWPSRRYLYDLIEHVGPQLEEFTLQFGTKEENEKSLNNLSQQVYNNDSLYIHDPTSILHQLVEKCKGSLKRISLINVPENQPIR